MRVSKSSARTIVALASDWRTDTLSNTMASKTIAFGVALVSFALASCDEHVEVAPSRVTVLDAKLAPGITASLERGENPRLVLVLDTEKVDKSFAWFDPSIARGDVLAAQRAAMFAQTKADIFREGGRSGIHLEQDFEHLPITAIRADDAAALRELLEDGRVAGIFEEHFYHPSDAASFRLVRQPAAVADGKDGRGTAVAVLDTGTDYRRADLGSCTAPGVPSSTCRVAASLDMAAEDGAVDTGSFHGTNVASIVAGFAPSTKIIGLDVFTGATASSVDILKGINWVIANRATYNIVAMNMSFGGGAFTAPCPNTSDALAVASARTAGVLSAVASGNNAYTNAMATPACSPAAVSVGAVYSADSFLTYTWGGGACTDRGTAAGAITCFSNATSFLTVLAPGAFITAGGITMGGTSQASPHVAGALAILRGAFPSESLDATVTRLTATGKATLDKRNGLSFPLMDIGAAASGCYFRLTPAQSSINGDARALSFTLTTGSDCAWSVESSASWLAVSGATSGTGPATIAASVSANTGALRNATLTVTGDAEAQTASIAQGVDVTPPTGTVAINNGATSTNAKTVALTLTATDPSGVAGMCVTNAAVCTVFEPFSTSKVWSLAGTPGTARVAVFLKDTRGNVTPAASAPSSTIIFDNAAPTGGVVTATPGDGQVSLRWSGFVDPLAGIDRYVVASAAAATAPTSCAAGTQLYTGADVSLVATGLTNGRVVSFRVCAVDRAGNTSTGVTASTTPAPEFDAPVGTVTIAGGAAYTTRASVALSIAATDASTTTQMCVSTAATCTAWETFATSKTLTLGTAAGVYTVGVWFKDNWGNTSKLPATARITFDAVAPINGTVRATPADGQVTLSWSGFSDATSGLDSYLVAYATGATPPTTCAGGTTVSASSAATSAISGLTNGSTYTFRVCAIDRAGNTSAGATVASRPAPEFDAPTGSVLINGGALYARVSPLALTIAATDASGVASMCVSTAATCTAWEIFATSKSLSVTAAGTVTVNVWFKDTWGNTSAAPVKSTIIYDVAAPTGGAVRAVAGNAQVALTWSGFADAGSGVANYLVVEAEGAVAPASCTGGTPGPSYGGTSMAYTSTMLTNGTTYSYRVCAVDRAGNTSAGVTVTSRPAPEFNAPTGSVVINGGASYARVSPLALTIDATDASGVASMCVSTAATCTAWEIFATSKSLSVTAAGTVTVNVWFKDTWGNTSAAPVKSTIIYDVAAPTGGAVRAVAGNEQVALTWTGFADSGSGIGGYVVVSALGAVAPADCATGTAIYSGPLAAFTATGLTNGSTYAFRVCAVDRAGNTSAGATVTSRPAPEFTAPTGSVVISGGARYTRVRVVTLTVAATDASGVDSMCLSSTTTCSVWEPFATSREYTLGATAGIAPVYAWFRDIYGNATTTPSGATIVYDPAAPTNGTVRSATAATGAATFTWSGFADPTSGLDGYVVAEAAGTTPPADCASGTLTNVLATVTTATRTGVSASTPLAVRVCAVDKAGNVSTGATVIAR